ncbi:MAG: hypothetical protein IKI38_01850 [Mogibacterium sp.]|nr:hypothetical protein [Mogibacterium sp.]
MSKEKKDDRLNYDDVSVFMNIREGLDIFLGGDENFPGLMDRLFETYKKASKHHDGDRKSETFGQLDPEYEKEVKELASEVIEKIDEYEKNRVKDEAHPHAEALREGIADQIRIEAESMRDGLHLMSDDKTREKAFEGTQTLRTQLGRDMMKPENADKLEEALKDYPLDKFVQKGNEIQRAKNEIVKKEDDLTPEEKADLENDLLDKKKEMAEIAGALREKSVNPTPETASLFKKDALNAKEDSFAGKKGLEGIIESYGAEKAEREFSPKADIPDKEMEGLDSSLELFNKDSAGHDRKESEQHKGIREAAEKVQENLKKLRSGVVTDGTGEMRPLTPEEKQNLMTDTVDDLNDLSQKTNAFISGSMKNDNAAPDAPTNDQLMGARGIRDQINGLQDAVMTEYQRESRLQKEREARHAGAGVKESKQPEVNAAEVESKAVQAEAVEAQAEPQRRHIAPAERRARTKQPEKTIQAEEKTVQSDAVKKEAEPQKRHIAPAERRARAKTPEEKVKQEVKEKEKQKDKQKSRQKETAEKEAYDTKGGRRRKLSKEEIKEFLMGDEKKPEKTKVVREPVKRTQLEINKNEVLDNNKAVQPRKR